MGEIVRLADGLIVIVGLWVGFSTVEGPTLGSIVGAVVVLDGFLVGMKVGFSVAAVGEIVGLKDG